ncbi:MAG: Gfo/Idh/MocA family oxidoreductase [Pirellulales bacterium]
MQSSRRQFMEGTLAAGAAAWAWSAVAPRSEGAENGPAKTGRIKVGVIGCGSVSTKYFPQLAGSPYVELVSCCDIIPERAERAAAEHKIPHHYPHIEKMLAGAEFDMLVNLTDMQEHEHLNREAVAAGKHIWSEKPIANSLQAGQEILESARRQDRKIWGAPIPVMSPQFAFMAQTIGAGKLGRLAAAHATYGHEGPNWSAFFYQKKGGSLPDLGVYNLTTLTGLLGPAREVTALTSIVTKTREIYGRGTIDVTEEDNAMVLMDHGNGVMSHVQSGFNYFNPHGHEGKNEQRHTVSIVGSQGYLGLVGYDWEPLGVDFASHDEREMKRYATDAQGYVWQQGAVLAAESLVKGSDLLVTPEHALHVLEIITAARESQVTGRRIKLSSTFRWPVVS